MSDDLIRRQDAIDSILECCTSDCDNEYECGYDDGLRKGVHKLKHLSSAQPERKKGKWRVVSRQADSFTAYRCSECNELVYARTNFCPNCGADMRGENNGQLAEG